LRLSIGFLKNCVKVWICALLIFMPSVIVASPSLATPIQEVVTGGQFDAFVLKSDGTVWAWGSNCNGALGTNAIGTSASDDALVPLQVPGLKDVISVANGYALKSDGIVWTWGSRPGIGSPVPRQVPGLTNVEMITASRSATYVVKSDGSVWAWGTASEGQIGNSPEIVVSPEVAPHSDVPVLISGLTDVTDIAAGGNSAYAIRSDGTMWEWGEITNDSVPVEVSGLTGVTAIAAGEGSAYALESDGTVWAWGDNGDGQLGDDSTVDESPSPVEVSGLTGVTAIAAGEGSGYALKSDGTVWAWGRNEYGQLGTNCPSGLGSSGESNTDAAGVYISRSPIQVTGLSNVIAIGATENQTAYAVKSDGTVWAWGLNQDGELGNNSEAYTSSVPVQVSGLTGMMLATTTVSPQVSTPLPHPSSSAVPSVPAMAKSAVFTIGSKTVTVDGTPYQMDVAPYIDSAGRTQVPVRYLGDVLGMTALWNAKTQQVNLMGNSYNDNESLTIGSNQLDWTNETQNGVTTMDTTPVIVPPGRTMLPARWVAQAAGYQVSWDAANQTVTVSPASQVSGGDGYSDPAIGGVGKNGGGAPGNTPAIGATQVQISGNTQIISQWDGNKWVVIRQVPLTNKQPDPAFQPASPEPTWLSRPALAAD
jgi:alpha-tubulin suppressor-like RCC1 family protein